MATTATVAPHAAHRPLRWLGAILVAALAFASPALGEVTIRPAPLDFEQPANIQIIVRNTTAVDTVRVEVDFPEAITIASLGPPPLDWGLRALPGGVEYRGGAIPPGERLEFTVRGVATAGGPAVWRVDQEYADLRVDRWTPRSRIAGAPPSPVPVDRPPDEVDPGGGGSGSGQGDGVETVASDQAGVDASGGRDGDGGGPPVWLGFVSILLALGALAAAGFVWARRPPPTDEPRPG